MTDDRIRQLRDDFAAAHKKGMDALAAKDYGAFGEAVSAERKIVEEQSDLIAEQSNVPAPSPQDGDTSE